MPPAVPRLLVALIACGALTVPQVPVRANAEPLRIEDLEIRGAKALSRGYVANHLLTRAPSRLPWRKRPALDPAELEEDMARIAALYRRHGYYEASAVYALRERSDERAVEVVIELDEGQPVRVAGVHATLAWPPDREPELAELLRELPLRVGDVFSADGYADSKALLLERLANSGYPAATLSGGAEVDLAVHEARVRWEVEPGPHVRFGPVRVIGLHRVRERTVLDELGFEEGGPYSAEQLRASQRRVFALSLFQSVVLEAGPGGEDPVEGEARWPVEVRVVERAPRSVRLGVGFGSEDKLRLQAAWEHRHLLRRARRLELEARHSSLLDRLEARVAQRRFLDRRTDLELLGRVERETLPSYEADRARASATLARRLGGPWSATLGYGLERNRTTEVSSAAEQVLTDPEDTFVLSWLELTARRSTLDDLRDPARGTSLDARVELASGLLGSRFDYAKLLLEARGFVPLWRLVLASRLLVGTIEPLATTSADDVPTVVRFFSGGSGSVRGFELQHLGPLDASEEPLGGTSLAEAGLELRFPIWRALRGVAFVDAGLVDLEPSRWRTRDAFYASGLGLRYRTPVGPLRLDFGYVLNPEEGIDRTRVHLGIGHAF